MGSGARMERMALGQALGESKAIVAHEKAMIPVLAAQAEAELNIAAKKFEQEIGQTEQLYLLANRLTPSQQSPMFITAGVDPGGEIGEGKPPPNLLLIGALCLAGYFLLKG